MTASHDLIVVPQGRPLLGSVPVPRDERIGPLAVLVAAIADEPSELGGAGWGEQTMAMVDALLQFGVPIEVRPDSIRMTGVSLAGLSEASAAVDCGSAPGIMRLLTGVLVAQSFASRLVGGPSSMNANMEDIAKPLRWRGGQVEGVFSPTIPGKVTPPLRVGPLPSSAVLSALECEIDPRFSDVKGTVLLSGLYADGATYVREPFVTYDHAERLLQSLDVPVATAGSLVELDPASWDRRIPGVHGRVPGDVSAAALLLAASALVPGSRVCARETGLNPTRTGALYVLRLMGGDVAWEVHAHVLGEPAGVACASHAPLRAAAVVGEVASRAVTDLGVLAALCARAEGRSSIDAPLSPGEPAEALGSVLEAFGVPAQWSPTGLAVEGRPGGPLRAADVDARDDPDLGALAVLLGLVGDGPTRVRRVDGLARRFPRIVGTLRALGADLRVEEGRDRRAKIR